MKKVGIILILFLIFSISVAAETDGVPGGGVSYDGLENAWETLDDQIRERLEQLGVSPDTIGSGKLLTVSNVWSVVKELLADSLTNPLSAGLSSMGVVLLCAVVQSLMPDRNGSMAMSAQYFGAVCIGAIIMVPVGYVLTKSVTAISAVGNFMMAFIPIYAGVLIAAGRALTAQGAGPFVFGAAQVLMYGAENLLVPLISIFWGLALCGAPGGLNIRGIASALKRSAVWILGLSTTLFTALLAISGLINGVGDSLSQRTTRFLIGNLLPVIGGPLSETFGTVQGCFVLLKTGSGVFGLCAVLVILLPVLTEVLLWRMILAVLTGVSELTETDGLTGLLQAVGDGMGLLLSVIVCCFVVYVVSLAVMVVAGGGG